MIREKIKKLIFEGAKEYNIEASDIELEHPKDLAHGDFSTNIAMKIAKERKENPLKIVENLVQILESMKTEEIDKVEALAPGFINFCLKTEYLLTELVKINKAGDDFGKSEMGKGKKILIDYSHPNIAKPIGVHHLLTTLIGESIKRIYQFTGFTTIADNFLGDWGTQFGKTIYAYKNWGDKKAVEKDPINELLKLYVRFHQEAENNPELEEKARGEFKKLEDGDKENLDLWKWMKEESLKELNELYKFLDVNFDYYNGEAFYNDKTGEIIKTLDKKGLLTVGEEGAKIVDLEKDNLGIALIQKKDKATLYLTRDLAAIKYRVENFKPEKILYVVESRQGLHLAQAFDIAEKASFSGETDLVHIKFGTMRFPDQTMSTRKGKVVFLWSVLEEAAKKARAIIEEKNPDLKDKDKIAEMVGIGAVKYAILSQNRVTDVNFTWEKMLSLEGNSAPYIMYTFARSQAILRKSKVKSQKSKLKIKTQKLEREEENLLRKLYIFPEIVERAGEEYAPNLITNYIYDLAQDFNSFYNKLPVLKAEDDVRDFRLALVGAVSQVIKNGMKLLSIELPEEM